MSLSKLGVGVIGTGMAATPHAKALNDLRDHIDLRGVFSRNAEKCKTFASRFELPFIKNIEDLINDPKLDIIIIITRRGIGCSATNSNISSRHICCIS